MTSNTEKSLQILKEEIQRLEEQGISGHILEELMEFRRENDTGDAAEERCIRPQIPFFGKEVLKGDRGSVSGENVLLCGGKATGKNILAENLAWLFRRPTYNISFHVNTDSSTLIGTDTFRNNEVQLREGPIIQCAKTGGFGILDEINPWQKTMPYRCCMQLWIIEEQLMCRDTKELHFIRLRVLSVR